MGVFLFYWAHHLPWRCAFLIPASGGLRVTNSFQSIFSFFAATCAAVTVHSLLSWVFNRQPSITRSLQDYTFSSSSPQEPDTPIGSPVFKIRMAFKTFGLNVRGREQFSLFLTIGTIGLGLAMGLRSLACPHYSGWAGQPSLISWCVAWSTVSGTIYAQ